MSVCLPTSLRTEQPVLGADPPWVFKRWTNVVLVKKLPPAGPVSVPIDCNKRQAIAPAFGQLWSEPAGIDCSVFPHTLLLSKELCQLALPNGRGLAASRKRFGSLPNHGKPQATSTSCLPTKRYTVVIGRANSGSSRPQCSAG